MKGSIHLHLPLVSVQVDREIIVDMIVVYNDMFGLFHIYIQYNDQNLESIVFQLHDMKFLVHPYKNNHPHARLGDLCFLLSTEIIKKKCFY